MPRLTKDERFASHLPETLLYHSKILADRPRMAALQRAVEINVTQGSTFLDVGSGAGVWAILAAKLGASRVVAVELEESMMPIIFKHAQENGVTDRIEIIHGNIDDVRLNERFDVIVAELFTGDVFSEATIHSIFNLRERYLSESGVLIPQWMEMWAAPLIQTIQDEGGFDFPVKTHFLRDLRLNYGNRTTATDRTQLEFAAEPKLLKRVDYLTVKETLRPEPMSAQWELEDVSAVDSVIVYCKSQYAPGAVLDTWESDTWFHEKYEFTPFEVRSGVLKFSASFDPANPSWSMSLPTHPETTTQNFSPVFAYTRARMAFAATPFERTHKRKKSD